MSLMGKEYWNDFGWDLHAEKVRKSRRGKCRRADI